MNQHLPFIRLFNKKRHLFCLFLLFFLSISVQARFLSALEVESLSLISPDYVRSTDKNFRLMGLSLQTEKEGENSFGIDTEGWLSTDKSSLNYLNVREFFYQNSSPVSWTIGRRLHFWSNVDHVWNLGHMQPQLRWNPLDVQEQGLAGIFLSGSPWWGGKLTVFASPLFIPDQGPGYELREGQFQSTNPWYRSPPQNIQFQGQLLKVDYVIHQPETKSIIQRPTYAVQWATDSLQEHQQGHFENGFWLQMTAASKPVHQLSLAYRPTLVTNRVRVDLYPDVYSEKILAADLGYEQPFWTAQLSALYSEPYGLSSDESLNRPDVRPSLALGPQLGWDFFKMRWTLSYLKISGQRTVDIGPDQSEDRASFSERFLFREAAQLQVDWQQIWLQRLLTTTTLAYQTSGAEEFQKIQLRTNLNWRGPWHIWAQLILIDSNESGTSAMSTYRDLDQFWLGVKYEM